jgi:hypothetical protein
LPGFSSRLGRPIYATDELGTTDAATIAAGDQAEIEESLAEAFAELIAKAHELPASEQRAIVLQMASAVVAFVMMLAAWREGATLVGYGSMVCWVIALCTLANSLSKLYEE